jgi:hypothetical protein
MPSHNPHMTQLEATLAHNGHGHLAFALPHRHFPFALSPTPTAALHNNSLLHKKSGGCTKTRGIKYRNSAYLPGLFFGFSARRFCVAVIFFFLTGRFGPLFIAASTERSGRLHASLLISAS